MPAKGLGSALKLLARAEELLSVPSLAHNEEAAALLTQAVASFRPAEALRLRPSLNRVSALVEAGWRARMSLHRIASAGQAGYRPDGAAQYAVSDAVTGAGFTTEG